MRYSQPACLIASLACILTSFSVSASAAERSSGLQSAVNDVALHADGSLVGRFVDGRGQAIDGAVVTLSHDQEIIARTTTDQHGFYRFHETRSGVYRVTAGQSSRDVRAWPTQVAPPGSHSYATIVETSAVLRAQGSGPNVAAAVGVATGITGAVVGGIALDKASDAEDDVAALKALLNSVSP